MNSMNDAPFSIKFMDSQIEEKRTKNNNEFPKFVTLRGYYNSEISPMTLEDILNYMYSKKYEFMQFIWNEGDRNVHSELLFKYIS